jgi:hypothetical protein
MRVDTAIEMDFDYLANQVNRLDDINIHSKKANRTTVLNKRKRRMMAVIKEALTNFRELRVKLALLENENRFLRSQVKSAVDEDILQINENLRAEIKELRLELDSQAANYSPEEERLSA